MYVTVSDETAGELLHYARREYFANYTLGAEKERAARPTYIELTGANCAGVSPRMDADLIQRL